jgi:hypothetical protein
MAKQKKVQQPVPVYGVPGIPEALSEVIEHERDNIGGALTLLQCLSLAINAREGEDSLRGPFFPAAIDAIVAMLVRTMDAFDPGNIEERLKPVPRSDPSKISYNRSADQALDA